LKQWLGNRRFVYNRVLGKIKKEGEKVNFYTLRNKYVTSKNNPNVEEWQLSTPKDIRAGAIRDIVKNYKTSFSQLKSRQINHFNMRFASKRDSPSIEIPKTALKMDNGIFMYKRYIPNKIKIGKRQSKIKLDINYDCRLQFKHNKWFLIVPIKIKAQIVKKKRKEYCSLDPGIRSFQTVYSEDMVLQIKVRKEMIKKLQTKIDIFKSLRNRKIIKRKRLKRRERKVYYKLNNLIDDLHHKTSDFLTKTFNYIILPSFESQEIAKNNKIRCVNRDLLQLKHYLFQQRLKAKCELRNCTLDICTEEYTSKTCGFCGCLNNVGSKDVYSCNQCHLIIDRDVNGARNIAIKRLKELGG
jgi:transposase